MVVREIKKIKTWYSYFNVIDYLCLSDLIEKYIKIEPENNRIKPPTKTPIP